MSLQVPQVMRALVLQDYGPPPANLRMETRAVPRPRPGEVLVRVAASPVNPSDLAFIEGSYAMRPPAPLVGGLEGSGLVVEAGSGLMARRLLGHRVAFSPEPSGAWAEFATASALRCVVLPRSVTYVQGAMALVNPIAALGMISRVRELGARAFVNTAAAGALGRMLLRLGRREGLEVVNVVHRAEQANMLRDIGAAHVLVSEAADFPAGLQELCAMLRATVALDAISGPMTRILLDALPPHSHVIVYGGLASQRLSGAEAEFDVRQLVFEDKHLEGFYVPTWLAGRGLPGLLLLQRRLISALGGDLGSRVHELATLEEAPAAIERYRADMTSGKLLIQPNSAAFT